MGRSPFPLLPPSGWDEQLELISSQGRETIVSESPLTNPISRIPPPSSNPLPLLMTTDLKENSALSLYPRIFFGILIPPAFHRATTSSPPFWENHSPNSCSRFIMRLLTEALPGFNSQPKSTLILCAPCSHKNDRAPPPLETTSTSTHGERESESFRARKSRAPSWIRN